MLESKKNLDGRRNANDVANGTAGGTALSFNLCKKVELRQKRIGFE